jgi:hypothetical protein
MTAISTTALGNVKTVINAEKEMCSFMYEKLPIPGSSLINVILMCVWVGEYVRLATKVS